MIQFHSNRVFWFLLEVVFERETEGDGLAVVLDEFSSKFPRVPRVSLCSDASSRIGLFVLMADMTWPLLMTFSVA